MTEVDKIKQDALREAELHFLKENVDEAAEIARLIISLCKHNGYGPRSTMRGLMVLMADIIVNYEPYSGTKEAYIEAIADSLRWFTEPKS